MKKLRRTIPDIDLTQRQYDLIQEAVENDVPILISGQHGPTGKSSLCGYLRSIGADVREQWEIEQGKYKQENEDNNANTVYCLIVLNKLISA